jgi:preprotein translocase subunit SecY
MIEALINAFRAPDIRRRILFVLAMLVVYRLLAVVPVPNVNHAALDQLINNQTFLQLLDLFSGGGLRSFSIVAMGATPRSSCSSCRVSCRACRPCRAKASTAGRASINTRAT